MKNSHVGQWFGSDLQCRRVLDRGGFDDNTIRCALAAHGEYGAHMCWPGSWPHGLGHRVLASILGRLGLRVPINAVQNSASALNSPATILANSIGSDHSCSALQPDPRNAPTSVREVAAPQSRPCGADQRLTQNMHLLSGQEPGAQLGCSQTRSRLAAPTPTDLMAISKRRRA